MNQVYTWQLQLRMACSPSRIFSRASLRLTKFERRIRMASSLKTAIFFYSSNLSQIFRKVSTCSLIQSQSSIFMLSYKFYLLISSISKFFLSSVNFISSTYSLNLLSSCSWSKNFSSKNPPKTNYSTLTPWFCSDFSFTTIYFPTMSWLSYNFCMSSAFYLLVFLSCFSSSDSRFLARIS